MFDAMFWRSVGARAIRQAAQTVIPVLVLVAATGQVTGASLTAVAVAAVTAVAVTVLTSMSGVVVDPVAPWWARAAERAAKAAAGSLLGFVTTSSLLDVSWPTALAAAGAAGVLSVVQAWLSPPGVDSVEHRRAARHLKTEGGGS